MGVEQLLDSEKIALDEYFVQYEDEIDAGFTDVKGISFLEKTMKSYINSMPDRRNQMLYTDADGRILLDVRNDKGTGFFEKPVYPNQDELDGQIGFGRTFQIEEHAYAVPIIRQVRKEPERYIIEIMNMSEIYDYLGTAIEEEQGNGYVALKNQEGYILYHNNPQQIGLHMVEGRRAKYPDLNFDYMEDLLRLQVSGEEATYVYDSYWMMENQPVKKRKKIASFTPLQLNHELWVLTLNLDYHTYISPLQRYMYLGLFLSFLVFGVIGWMMVQLIQGQEKQQKMELENRYLQELNAAMEEVNRERIQRIHAWKMGQVGIMTEKIAHDLKNFLMPILGYSEFLADAENLNEGQQEDVEKIMDYAEKAAAMARQLNQFGRQEQVTVSYEVFDFGVQLGEWLKSLVAICPTGIHIKWNQISEHMIVYGNATQLQEVVFNLCKNAADAMLEKDCSGKEKLLLVNCQTVTCSQIHNARFLNDDNRNYLELSISDTGCGMNETVMAEIFNPFFTTKKTGEGTGLGLGICYDIVIQHGGEIQVTSSVGEGSCFTVYLPCQTENL